MKEKPRKVQLFHTCIVNEVYPEVGLSVATILERLGVEVEVPTSQTCCGQPAFNAGFHGDARKVARFTDRDVERLMQDASIVRNRLKIESTIDNARAFLEVQREFGSFSAFAWDFVGGRPLQTGRRDLSAVPARTELSDAFSKALKQRGFRFVGTTI